MESIKGGLLESPLALLFMVVALGYLVGEIRFPGNFRLGVAAVLFVGLGFGIWEPRLAVPEAIQALGLVLFVYCIGLQAGPGFLQNFRRKGVGLNLSLAAGLLTSFGLCCAMIVWLKLPAETVTGLFCGALTNTPALGAARELLHRSGAAEGRLNGLVVGYGIAYPFGVATVLALIHLRAGRRGGEEQGEPRESIRSVLTLEVRTRDATGKDWTAAALTARTGLIFTRFQPPGGAVRLVEPDTELPIGSAVVAVGNPGAIEEGLRSVGPASTQQLQESLKGFELKRYFVSRHEVAGRSLTELAVGQYGGVVTRVRRGDVDLPVRGDLVLQLGDRVRVLCYSDREPQLRKVFGNSVTSLTETGYFSFGLGICLGLALGLVKIPLPGLGVPFQFGLAGGPLIVALIVGAWGRTGPIIWNLPNEVNLTLRNLGTLFFLAGVGVKAGAALPGTLAHDGPMLAGLGFGLVLLTQLAFLGAVSLIARCNAATAMGAMAALQTQPAALSFANSRIAGGEQNIAYASVYPFSVIFKIILAQVLIGIFH